MNFNRTVQRTFIIIKMAEGRTTSNSSNCWFFSTYGNCRQGENCPYQHVTTSGPFTCRFHRQGRCKFGRNCSPKATLLRNKPSSLDDTDDECTSLPRPPNEWVQAPEFVPNKSNDHTIPEAKGPKSYAEVVNTSAGNNGVEWSPPGQLGVLCPYSEAGECKLGDECTYLHGLLCELCGKACLHPLDKEQHKQHHSECVKQHEKDMELSFAVARSKDKMCGICFEVIMEKNHREQRFGILPNCNHCFCLSCIRTWRQAKQFENNITRACPECRVTSDFVCPSMYWVDTKEDKEKLITDYKGAL
ncbi:hypothetical protein B566_EDAN015045, partial [Ephemera danica]